VIPSEIVTAGQVPGATAHSTPMDHASSTLYICACNLFAF
jgi:hypothetical protein